MEKKPIISFQIKTLSMHKLFIFLFLTLGFPLNGQVVDSTQLLFRNAFILDFQSNKFQKGDILIQKDTITEIQFGKSIQPFYKGLEMEPR